MKELIKYVKITDRNLTDDEITALEEYLSNTGWIEAFRDDLTRNYEKLSENDLDARIVNFILRLPQQRERASWQVTTRVFCEELYERLIGIIAYEMLSESPNYKLTNIVRSICNACRCVILSPITLPVPEDIKPNLIEAIQRHTTYYIMPNEDELESAIELLQKLGISENDIKIIRGIKERQKGNIQGNIRSSNHKKKKT